MKIKKHDQVLIIAGKDKGKKGKVLRAIPARTGLIVEGANLVTKHIKPRREGEKGQRVKVPNLLNISNVKLLCPKCNKPTRVGYNLTDKGKFRMCKKCGQEI